jgi:uncharacterized protein (TIGR01777 family)
VRILVSGSTGFLGTAVVDALERQGHTIARLVRPGTAQQRADGSHAQAVQWDPVAAQFDAAGAEGADALIHLAGASIASGRWNASRKSLLRTSRIDATRHLMGALAKLQRPPRTIVAASAIGYYGNRGDETLTEASAPGNDFLAGLCREWEAETSRGTEFGARVVNLRFGIILAQHGGALPRMALPFKLGAGGRLGDGRQWMSWILLQETVRIIQFALTSSELAGPVNAVAPNPARNREFTRILAKTLHRPALFPAPAFGLRLALGEMADALLLVSQKVIPSRLTDTGYTFSQPSLASALEDVFQK